MVLTKLVLKPEALALQTTAREQRDKECEAVQPFICTPCDINIWIEKGICYSRLAMRSSTVILSPMASGT